MLSSLVMAFFKCSINKIGENEMAKVIFHFEDGTQVEASAAIGENLLEVARKVNVAIDAPCSGNASCGKCKVKFRR